MHDSVKHGISDRWISDSIIPVVDRQLGCQYYRLPLMAVFDDIQQDGTFLGIQRYEEGVIEDEQLTPLDLLELSLYRILGLCHLERAEELRRIGIQGPYTVLAGMIAHSRSKEALACSCRAGNKEVLSLTDKVERQQPLHLVLAESPVDCVVYLLRIGIVAEGCSAYQPLYGCR